MAAPASRSSLPVLVAVGLLLLVLAVISFGLSFVSLGRLALPAALGIAVLKALAVLFTFMEFGRLSTSARLAAFAALFMLGLLVGLMVADVRARDAEPLPAPLPHQTE